MRFPDDPFAQREQETYEHPIPSREYILSLLLSLKKPFTFKNLLKKLKLKGPEDEEALDYRLQAMLRAGQLQVDNRNRFVAPANAEIIEGIVSAHREGFGFVINKNGEDAYLSMKEMSGLMDGDRVLVCSKPKRGSGSKREGFVLEIKSRACEKLVGRLCFYDGFAVVEPEQQNIKHRVIIPPDGLAGAIEGQVVVVELTQFPNKQQEAYGKIIEVLGDYMAPGMEIDIALRSYQIPYEWPKAVTAEAEKVSPKVLATDKADRVDLTDLPLVTIDGEDAKDFDDAVLCQATDSGYRLYVAIADVSHYVRPGSALDEEAILRGNSVYFPGYVVPMLPESLSNGICSLKPNVERLSFVCQMEFSPDGECQEYQFYKAVIKSHARLTYSQVAAVIEESDYSVIEQCATVLPQIYDLFALYEKLITKRGERGALDFESSEVRFVFNKNRKIEKIVPVIRNQAHRLIEECMLAANVAAADYVQTNKLPVLYRVHDSPPENKVESLKEFLHEFGLKLSGKSDPKPKDYAKLLEEIESKQEKQLLQTVLLRSLSQAIYTPDNEGHFGLAYDAYTHFTSPIRRYADLLLHRMIDQHISGKKSSRNQKAPNLQQLGEQVSMTERRADDATRDVVAWLKCEFMQEKLGEEFTGTISGVTHFGFFVTIDNLAIDGLVHISSLDKDYYHYDANRHVLISESGSKSFRLGDKVEITVARVDLDARKLDFVLSESKKSS